jgi:hypothetical protein
MFQWYRDAQVCYAYLADVPVEEKNYGRWGSKFRSSTWFTRGWTLQELLAPETVVFFNYGWVEIGTRGSLNELIASITTIDKAFLENFGEASVAQKFSWASKRQSLRTEDAAYSLMGLFGVHMPLLYGEGNDAFIRLQLEIMKSSDDDSLFAWANRNGEFHQHTPGLLAPSPAAFERSGNVLTGSSRSTIPYSMTNKGLHISLMLIPILEALERAILVTSGNYDRENIAKSDQFVAPLACYTESTSLGEELPPDKQHKLLRLGRVSEDNGRVWYTRLSSDTLEQCSSDTIPSQLQECQIFIPQPDYFQRQEIPGKGVLKFVICAERSFRYEFDFSSYIGDSRQLTHHSRIKKGGSADKVGPELKPLVELILSSNLVSPSRVLVEFKGLNGPQGFQEGFILEIVGQLRAARRPVGISLLASSGRPLVEISKERRNTISYIPRDRDTLTFPSVHVLSAALRKQMGQDGELMYAIDLDIKSLLLNT